jgi:hypothetical protein
LADFHYVRFQARVLVNAIPSSPNFAGIVCGWRASVVIDGVYRMAIVIECDGVLAPGESGDVVLEMISEEPNVITPGVSFEFKCGPTKGADGVVVLVQSIRRSQ